MNERIIFSDFISSFANRQKGDKQNAERLLTLLFELIEKSLMIDKVVKVRHIGIFKLEWFEQRKITNVNTGEISEIGGYYRLAFTPDKEMAAAVNENYSHLQAVSLTNGLEAVSEKEEEILDAVGEDIKEEKIAVAEKSFIPLNEIKEELQDARSIIQEIAAMNEEKHEQSPTSDTDDLNLLQQLYQSETKTMFSDRYSDLIAGTNQEKESNKEVVQTSTSNKGETTANELPSVSDMKGGVDEIVDPNEDQTKNNEVENEIVVQEIVDDTPIETTDSIDSIDTVLAHVDRIRDTLFTAPSFAAKEQSDQEVLADEVEDETNILVKEITHEQKTCTETRDKTEKENDASDPVIEEIVHEPAPTSTESIGEQAAMIDDREQKEFDTLLAPSNTQPNEIENDREGGHIHKFTKWSIAGIVIIILLIIATFGYIYSGYFNKGKVGQKDIFEQTYESFIKLFEPKSVEIKQNDMTLSRKDTTPTNSSKEETRKANVKTQTDTPSTSLKGNKSNTTTAADRVVKVDFAETLSSIARREYGSRFFWCYIYEANKAKISNINNLRSGIELVIPNKDRLGIDPNNEASLNQAKEKCQAIENEHKNQ